MYHYTRNGTLIRQIRVLIPPFVPAPGVDLPAAEADFTDIDLSEDGRRLLIANVNQSNSLSTGDGDVLICDLQTVLFQGAANRWVIRVNILQAPDGSSDMKFAAWVQAPIATVNGPLTVVSSTQPSHGTLDCDPNDGVLDGVKPDGSYCHLPDPDFFGRDEFFYVVSDADGKMRGASVTLTVFPQNDPPVLTPAVPTQQMVSDEDAVLTVPLTALVNGGPGTTTVADVDRNDPLGGIAVTETSGPGVWSFSLDGTVFVDIGVVRSDNALHLPWSADIRFTPTGSGGGTAVYLPGLGPDRGHHRKQVRGHLGRHPVSGGRGGRSGHAIVLRRLAAGHHHVRHLHGVQSGCRSEADLRRVDDPTEQSA